MICQSTTTCCINKTLLSHHQCYSLRDDKTRISKKRCLRMESLPHDVVSRILERLPVKSLLRFKAVSNQWKSTIESRFFQGRHLTHRQQSGDPDVAMVSVGTQPSDIESLRTLVLGSSSSVKIPAPWEKENTQNTAYLACYNSFDGLLCLYHFEKSGFVVNPTTRWYRPLPLCEYHQHVFEKSEFFRLGFGKDIFTDTYKPVWLYNSSEIGLENATTTCQVFDFSTNAWRYVTPAAPYRIVHCVNPVFVDGSLHWFTDCEETKVVSFDLHTEAFQVISKAPFVNSDPSEIVLCNLDDHLCVSERKWPDQVIWSFNSNNKTWNKMFSIDLDMTYLGYGVPTFNYALQPLALLDGGKKKKKLLYYDRVESRQLFRHEPKYVYDDVVFSAKSIGDPVCYFPSLISIS